MKAVFAGLAFAFAAATSTAAFAETTVIKHRPAVHKKVIIKHGHRHSGVVKKVVIKRGHHHNRGVKKVVIKHRD